jgi:hypothetical protein
MATSGKEGFYKEMPTYQADLNEALLVTSGDICVLYLVYTYNNIHDIWHVYVCVYHIYVYIFTHAGVCVYIYIYMMMMPFICSCRNNKYAYRSAWTGHVQP